MSFGYFFLALFLPWASANDTAQFAGKIEMNGIRFADYQSAAVDWTLVTIRYRKDTGELRLTYANPIAQKVLSGTKKDYPDGAVFLKTGILTGADGQFPSSAVPRAVRRYQVMVKDRSRFAATDGWGYALFDASGKTYPEEPSQTQQACHACHAIVENRGYIFSEPFDFTLGTKFSRGAIDRSAALKFVTLDFAKLAPKVQKALDAKTKRVRFLDHEVLRGHVFQGTLDEIKPLLEVEALRSGLTAVFVAQDGLRFSAVQPLKRPECLNELGAEVFSTKPDGELMRMKVCLHD